MSFLEKKIKDNNSFFDDEQLTEGHKQRFSDRLDNARQANVKRRWWPYVWRVAAVLILLVSGYFVLQTVFSDDFGGTVMNQVTEITFGTEIENVFAYYDALSEQKIEKVDELAPNEAEASRIKQIAQKKLEQLDASLAEIEKEYAKNPGNKMLKAAIVNNKRKKSEIMDNILQQLDDVKMPPKDIMPDVNRQAKP